MPAESQAASDPIPTTTPTAGAASELPRPEYPRPQFVRADWLNLNGYWQFEIDPGDSGLERGLLDRELSGRILVPFAPESSLSGVGEVDWLHAVWYRRTVRVPEAWAGRTVLLHFQAVDYDTTVWVNGTEVARHRGGWTPFTANLGEVAGQEITIVVRARDPKGEPIARGKQSDRYGNYGCLYTRTTGIWQTVWMEPVPTTHLRRPRITPDVAGGAFHLELPLAGPRRGITARARLTDDAGVVSTASVRADLDFAARLTLPVPEERRRLWSPEDPFLYGLELELVAEDGTVVDSATSYAGLRSVTIDGHAILLNGQPVFQRLVLDQGYYPDGILTAPDDAALVRDIELAKAAGFNGARLHQKVFEERFLYHADRLGYLCWGEFGDWGCNTGKDGDNQQPGATYITQWLEAVERDYSHPSIIGWCPLNETWQRLHDRITVLDDVTRGMFLATKAADQTRPVLDASGYSHRVRESDVYDSHNYEQDPEKFAAAMAGLAEGRPFTNSGGPDRPWSVPYAGQPYFCSEFGGIWWNPDAREDEDSWGYGERPRSLEEFYQRFEALVSVLLDDPKMFGYCYTQLTDVYQEQNGIYRFDRSQKFDLERIRAAQTRPAAIEKAAR
ncbi:glycoside hydrolase family 2 protein [Thermasporomyces composti]|uniref:Glycosyl hydrolase family 2 n=1 Tax=Thermasporomyces composti TaxID=696763 RepID=A0A3D9V576_THECX|nr:sugar-binding domain-containing protein [Thermasporomyces composti]REF35853.1 glycosyl hydrolase family 2 [Thermasporomyces composti]